MLKWFIGNFKWILLILNPERCNAFGYKGSRIPNVKIFLLVSVYLGSFASSWILQILDPGDLGSRGSWVLGIFDFGDLWPWGLGLSTFRSFSKIFSDSDFCYAFRHAKFNGTEKNIFQVLLGVANLIWNFLKSLGSKKLKMWVISDWSLRYVKWCEDSKSGREIQIG